MEVQIGQNELKAIIADIVGRKVNQALSAKDVHIRNVYDNDEGCEIEIFIDIGQD